MRETFTNNKYPKCTYHKIAKLLGYSYVPLRENNNASHLGKISQILRQNIA